MLEHVRDLWTLHGIQSTVTASMFRNEFGLELRIELAGELIESRFSRVGEEPLILIAAQAKAELRSKDGSSRPTRRNRNDTRVALCLRRHFSLNSHAHAAALRTGKLIVCFAAPISTVSEN